jgi:hypothetical protein
MTNISTALEILRWGAARTDGMSASLTPAQCTAVLDYLRKRIPKHVMRFENGMVAVFNEAGEQIPELQGKYEDVAERIRVAATSDTVFEGVDTVGAAERDALEGFPV